MGAGVIRRGDLPEPRRNFADRDRASGRLLPAFIFLVAVSFSILAPPAAAQRDALPDPAPVASTQKVAAASATPAVTSPAQPSAQPSAQPVISGAAVAGSLAGRLAGTGDTLTIDGQSLPAAVLRDSYAAAGYAPIWTNDNGLGAAGALMIDQLRTAHAAGMTMIDSLLAAIAAHAGAKSPAELADLELLMSGALLAAEADSGDLPSAALLAAARQSDPRSFLAVHLPGTFFYWRLRQALPLYRHYVAAGGWPTVPAGPKLEKGMTDPRVAALGRRLLVTGELAALGSTPELFDDALEAALRKFQASHGLDIDGKVGSQTVAALNVPADDRLGSILLNLERFRQLAPSMGARYLYVNVAGMELFLVEQGQVTFHNRVIVGRVDRKTPLLQSVIRRIDFNPTWVVPPKIARIDMLNHLRQDPNYFRSHNVRVYDGWSADAHEIDAESINWGAYGASNMPYVLRQDPGPENALGPLKFDFANDYAVYIHGTPVKSLFALGSRALSSGCVRMEQPVDMAAYLLRKDPNWPRSRIDDVVRKATTISASVPPLPVMLTYQTAWVDADGVVQFRADIYKLDDIATYASASAAVPGAAGAPSANAGAGIGGKKS
jgi:L,D-transpeptidase YcbB